MAGIGTENRCHVENISAQFFYVRQTPDDSPKRAFQVRFMVYGRLVPELIGNLFVRGKTGGKNLVNHFVFRPGGQLKALFFPEILGAVEHSVNACDAVVIKAMISVVSLFSGSIFQFKEIAETDYINFYRGFIVIYIC